MRDGDLRALAADAKLRALATGARADLDEVKRAFEWFLTYHKQADEVAEHFDASLDVVVTYRALKHKYPEGA